MCIRDSLGGWPLIRPIRTPRGPGQPPRRPVRPPRRPVRPPRRAVKPPRRPVRPPRRPVWPPRRPVRPPRRPNWHLRHPVWSPRRPGQASKTPTKKIKRLNPKCGGGYAALLRVGYRFFYRKNPWKRSGKFRKNMKSLKVQVVRHLSLIHI